ncbi:MAG: hypothetical protein WC196_04085 [Bacilli bacterium]|nr:hypothetical protein [Bacilli bacterium]MDD4066078.1 hypothetical protein [Bacilli bacterium]
MKKILLITLLALCLVGCGNTTSSSTSTSSSSQQITAIGNPKTYTEASVLDISTKSNNYESFIFLVSSQECYHCEQAYPLINAFLTYHNEYDIYRIDVHQNEDGSYVDSYFNSETIKSFGDYISQAIYDSTGNPDNVPSMNGYSFLTPTLIIAIDGYAKYAMVGIPSYQELSDFIINNYPLSK